MRRGGGRLRRGALGSGGTAAWGGRQGRRVHILGWGPSVLRKGRFDVTINLVCEGEMKTVTGIVVPGFFMGDVGNLRTDRDGPAALVLLVAR